MTATSPSASAGDLVPIAEAQLPDHLVTAAKAFMVAARAERTNKAYAYAWALFATWCATHHRQALPASPETIAAWIAALANGDEDGKPRARATVSQYLSAVIVAHRTAGHAIDRKATVIADVLKGINNTKAVDEADREARPLVGPDLRDLLRGLRLDVPSDARDAVVLSLAWAGALRRSELVALDWQRRGDGLGWVTLDERGIVITLAKSKASQGKAETIIIPAAEMPTACAALDAWAEVAKLEPGQPLLRPVDRRQVIGGSPATGKRPAIHATIDKPGLARLTDHSVSRIVKARVRALLILRGKSNEEAAVLVERFSGHSMRAGYVTTGAAEGISPFRMQQQTRHKSLNTLAKYVREADKWRKSGLKGIGF